MLFFFRLSIKTEIRKSEEVRKIDEQRAIFLQTVSDHLNISSFIAMVVATSRTEPDVDLEKVITAYLRQQLKAAEAAGSPETAAAK